MQKNTVQKLEKKRVKARFVIKNDRGLHTRPSTELVKCASKFKSLITLTIQNTTVNAKSLLGILMLAACKGTRIILMAEGVDADEAVEAILQLANNNFNIHY